MMEELLYTYKTFEKEIALATKITNKEFENCVFKNCDFSNSDFSNNMFTDCEFIACNLSMTQLVNSQLQTVFFQNCKLLGIQFQACSDFLFSVHFEECIIDYASFAHKKMPKTKFNSCSLKEVNFVGTNLTNASFENCNLDNAIFNETQLAGADFMTACNYKINPEFNPMKKAKFSTVGLLGLLDQYDIKIE